jgi:hypothetical protein
VVDGPWALAWNKDSGLFETLSGRLQHDEPGPYSRVMFERRMPT